jgi:hypothetical protein
MSEAHCSIPARCMRTQDLAQWRTECVVVLAPTVTAKASQIARFLQGYCSERPRPGAHVTRVGLGSGGSGRWVRRSAHRPKSAGSRGIVSGRLGWLVAFAGAWSSLPDFLCLRGLTRRGAEGKHARPLCEQKTRVEVPPRYTGRWGSDVTRADKLYSEVLHSCLYGSLRNCCSTSPQAPVERNRLEDRIRYLSESLLKAEGEEFHRLAAELRTALSEHITRIRNRFGQYPVGDDRRSRDKQD